MLAKLFDDVLAELIAYFDAIVDGTLASHEELELNLLSIADAIRWTNDFRGFHPIVDLLRGVILDDATGEFAPVLWIIFGLTAVLLVLLTRMTPQRLRAAPVAAPL